MDPVKFEEYSRIKRKTESMRDKVSQYEKLLLELVGHPEASNAQINEIRTDYMRIRVKLDEINDKLLKWRIK